VLEVLEKGSRQRSVPVTRPTPTLAEPVTVAEFWKNRRGELVRISLSTYKERNLIDVRTWATDPAEGKLKPTTKGIVTEVRYLPKLVSALVKAERREPLVVLRMLLAAEIVNGTA
jgi:Transcriptional Coactivator p15 (PC4)